AALRRSGCRSDRARPAGSLRPGTGPACHRRCSRTRRPHRRPRIRSRRRRCDRCRRSTSHRRNGAGPGQTPRPGLGDRGRLRRRRSRGLRRRWPGLPYPDGGRTLLTSWSDHSNVGCRGASVTAANRPTHAPSRGRKGNLLMLGRLGVLGAAALSVGSACGGAGGNSAAGCTIGVSWNNYQEERWAKWDEPAIKKAITDAGGKYVSNDAKSSAETQASNVDNLISQGAKVVIVLAQDGTAIKPAVAKAIAANVPVIAYDRLIEDPKALYITFDNVLVGKLQAQAIFAAKPKGNYAIIKGNKADANADFLRSGMDQVIGAAVKSGDIKIVGETYTDNWDPSKAQTNMEQILTQNQNKVDAVLSENDGMAGGVIAALTAQGLAGKVPVSGQDGDKAALNRVALGTQTVDVWKDAR